MPYNVILFTDTPNPGNFTRGYGAYRIAHEIRKHGYTVLTVDFASALDESTFTEILNRSIDSETIMVGFSTTWFPYRSKDVKNDRFVIGEKSLEINPRSDFDATTQDWYAASLAHRIGKGELDVFAKLIKERNPKIKIVIGGAKANEYIYEPSVDNVFIGYSENQIIDYLKKKRIFNKIINYDVKSQNGEFDFNTNTTEYVDTDCLISEELLTIEFSRGCIFNCTFCSFAHRGQDTRNFVKYQDTIRTELMSNWTKWGIYKYIITDDTFNDYTEKLVLINEVIQSLPFKPVFTWAYCRLDLISRNPEQAQLMKDIGIKEVYYGLESWSDDTSKAIRKGGSRSKKIEGMRIAKECWGDEVYIASGIVIGLPKDTVQSMNESVQWYIEEGHKYIDSLKYVSLMLRSYNESLDYQFLSDIEKSPATWGYDFPDKTNEFYWTKKDSGDIDSLQQADNIMLACNKQVKPYYNTNKSSWMDIYKLYDADYSNKSHSELFVNHVRKYYFPELLNKL
jgi:radical SAM superfamily enzyme YgiQ (UPF0313 family)